MYALRLPIALVLLAALQGMAETRSIAIGGASGSSWQDGGGQIQAVFPTGARDVERGNTPGGVIDFDPEGREGWIFPQNVVEGTNLALGLLGRGGSVSSPTVLEAGIESQLETMIDGDGETALERKNVAVIRGMAMDFDLGARFGVQRVQFFPRNGHPDFPAAPFQEDFIRGYELFFNDGSEETQGAGGPEWRSFRLDATNQDALVNLSIPPQFVRFIRLQSRTSSGFEIAEFRVFGTGFVPTAEYISNIFDLGPDLGLWGTIRWVEESVGPAGFSSVRVRTRTGLDDNPLVYTRRFFFAGTQVEVPWKKNAAVETEDGEVNLDRVELERARALFGALPLAERNALSLSLDEYQGLGAERGNVVADLDAWSPWSSPYDVGAALTEAEIENGQLGVPIVSLGPRRYIQFRIDFLSEDLEAATGIGPLAFTVATPPPAAQILGEIFPRQVELGKSVDFVYAVLPTSIRPGVDTGFDGFEIATPVRVEAIESIEVLGADGRSEAADFSGADLAALPATDESGRFAIEAVGARRFRVRFPLIAESELATGRTAQLRIRFRSRVLRYGTKFAGFAFNRAEGDVGQEVVAGNVAALAPGDDDIVAVGSATNRGLSVDVPLTGSSPLLINVRSAPRPFSPNGDGINDATHVHYDLSRLVSPAPVAVEIVDLAGRRVRRLFSGLQGGGSYAMPWDGVDGRGAALPPGIYLVRVTLASDAGDESAVRVVELVY